MSDDNQKNKTIKQSTDDMAAFCKKKGFVFQNSEIYGSFAGFFDLGHLGVELNNNVKSDFWKNFVQKRDNIVGIDGSICSHPNVWRASGHVDSFGDILVECKKCHVRQRGDHLVNEAVGIQTDGMTSKQIDEEVIKNDLKCPKCEGEFENAKVFNLMLKTNVGPVEDSSSVSYLRPETAQIIFTNYKNIYETGRVKLPFGIAQIGKAFRNEISPRNFLFRVREFEQAEIEFFIHPDKLNECPDYDTIKDMKVQILTSQLQKDEKEHVSHSFEELVDNNIIKIKWHAYWLSQLYKWFLDLGVTPENIRLREHLSDELAHYSKGCFDIEYKYPFGWQEIHGMSDRGTYDLTQHQNMSKKDQTVYDEETKQKVLGHVIEPSQGIGRAFLTFLYDAYTNDTERGNIVLKLHPTLSPIKVGVFPLVNKEGLPELATKIHKELQEELVSQYDRSGSVGRRYARADEIGIPYCITVDFESKDDGKVTLRDRDSTNQVRINIDKIKDIIINLIKGKIKFEELEK